jgi:hypothetical protein
MKLQINGFDIEVNTEESNMTVKVLDANGKELSNNTYTQSLEQGETITPVDMPSAEDTATETPSETPAEGVPTEDTTGGSGLPTEDDTNAGDGGLPTEDEANAGVGESFVPDFDTFKKLRKEGKI